MKTGRLSYGTIEDCRIFVSKCESFYVYILRRPDGRPFYVGKGRGDRVLSHENEARHANDRTSNAYKLNVIRSIRRSGDAVVYEIEFVTHVEDEAYAREADLISGFKRLHEGGPLTNLAPGGGSGSGIAPETRERHSATLGGIPENNPERATLNGFVLSIAAMKSVILKPLGQFTPRKTQPYPQKTMSFTQRQAAALLASAAANGISLDSECVIPRRVLVEGVAGFVENGVSCDIITSGIGTLIPADNPADECFQLTSEQSRKVVGLVGARKCFDLGVWSKF